MCWVAFFEINQLISCSSLCSYMCVGVGVVVGVVVDDVDVVVVMKTSDCLSHGYGSKLGTQKWRAPRHMFTANHWFNPISIHHFADERDSTISKSSFSFDII